MSNEDTSRLIVVLLRGAVDGLSVVIPYADEAYYRERQSIAIAPPGKPDGALDVGLECRILAGPLDLLPPRWWKAGMGVRAGRIRKDN